MKHLSQKSVVILLGLILFAYSHPIEAQTDLKVEAFQWIDENQQTITDLSDAIWEFAELPMEEYQSARLLADALEKNGFHVERGVAGMPTAFIATYGSGKPELGFLAEYDALPGLSQKAVPNVVPDHAVAWYNTRDVTFEGSEQIYERIKKIAKAAAMATETEVEIEFLTAIHELVVLEESSEVVQKNLELVGPPQFTAEEKEFARKVQKNLGIEQRGLFEEIRPLTPPSRDNFGGGGTDVAEVSWNAPVLRLSAATSPLGSPGHSWAIVCTGRTSIAHKGMLVAAKTLAGTVLDLMTQPTLLGQVRQEWKQKTDGKTYKSPLSADAVPPVVPEPKK